MWQKFFLKKDSPKLELILFMADTRKDPEISLIITEQKINYSKNNILVVLSTCIISTGITLRDLNFKNVFIYQETDMVELIQFINRFRHGVVNVYDFIDPGDILSLFNPEKRFEYLETLLTDFSNHINFKKVFSTQDLRFTDERHSPQKNIQDNFLTPFIYTYQNKTYPNHLYMRYYVLKEFHNVVYNCPDYRKEYLNYYKFENVSISKIEIRQEEKRKYD